MNKKKFIKYIFMIIAGFAICVTSCKKDDEKSPEEPGGGGGGIRPNSPTGVTAEQSGASIIVSWNSVADATSYKVYRSSDSLGTYSQVGSSTNNTQLIDDSPLNGYNYYKVTSVNGSGESNYSKFADCYYSGGGGETNANVRFTRQYPGSMSVEISNDNGDFNYSFSPDFTGLTDYYDVPPGYSYVVISEYGPWGSNEWDFYYDFEVGRKYTVYVDSSSVTDDGPIVDDKPNPPTGVTVSQGGSSIVVSWNSVSNATSYKVYRSSSAYGTYSQIGSSTSSTQLIDNDPFNGDNYYKVKAVNSAGESDYSDYAYGYYSGSGGNIAKLRFETGYGGYPLKISIYNSNGDFSWYKDPSQPGMTDYFDIPSGYSRVVIEDLVWEEEEDFYYEFESGRKYTFFVEDAYITDDGPM